MLRLTLAQMRLSLGRLSAAGLAIVIGTAFVTATLIAGAIITRTSYDALTASYANADLVVTAADSEAGGLTGAELSRLRSVPAVAAIDGSLSVWVEIVAGPKRAFPQVIAAASDARLEAQELLTGYLPTRPGEIAVPGPLATRLGVGVNDIVTANRQVFRPAPTDSSPEAGTWVDAPERLTVVGLLDDPAGAFAQSGGAVVAAAADAQRWASDSIAKTPGVDALPTYQSATVALRGGEDIAAATFALQGAAPEGTVIRTKDEQAAAITSELTGEADVFTMIVLGFAAIALLVAALVITNTFQVLIAQRTRTLALLRCVGADKKQLHRSVLLEASMLGAAASTLGLLLGVGLAQATLTVLGRMNLDVPLPGTVSITAAVVLAPLVTGTLVTILAAIAPARAATRITPLAALRPAEAPALTGRSSRPRLVLSTLLTVGGVTLLLLAVVAGRSVDAMAALGIGVLGGALSFVGVLLSSVFWVPAVVSAAGRPLARTGIPARLAAANTLRNPRRTSATSTALLIGVTLVSMMSTGAASARVTLNAELDTQYPVDVMINDVASVSTTDGVDTALVNPALVGAVADVPGVARAVALRGLNVQVGDGPQAGQLNASVIAVDDAAAVLRVPAMMAGLGDKTLVVAIDTARSMAIANGDVLTLTATKVGADGLETPQGKPIKLTAVVTNLPGGALLTPAVLARMTVATPTNQVWVRLADVSQAGTVVPKIEDALSETAVQIGGAGVERAQFQQVIDTLLKVVLGLLAVAVLIALIGVANTLSLSVIERRRESATLRALGLTRRQLRATLAIEGMLIAGVGALLGAALGTLYGWAGTVTVLQVVGPVLLDVPWRDLAIVILVALVAGLLASVIPGRRAARTSPVAALAVD